MYGYADYTRWYQHPGQLETIGCVWIVPKVDRGAAAADADAQRWNSAIIRGEVQLLAYMGKLHVPNTWCTECVLMYSLAILRDRRIEWQKRIPIIYGIWDFVG